MAILDNDIKVFEAKYKDDLFSQIDSLISICVELILIIKDLHPDINVKENIPNIGITLNNKLIELSHVFKDAGLSIFSSKTENYGILKLDFINSSFIGEAIIQDMIRTVDMRNSNFGKLYCSN